MAIVEDRLEELTRFEPDAEVDAELAGLDALDAPVDEQRSRAYRIWSAAWPKLARHRHRGRRSGSSWCGGAGGPSTCCRRRPPC